MTRSSTHPSIGRTRGRRLLALAVSSAAAVTRSPRIPLASALMTMSSSIPAGGGGGGGGSVSSLPLDRLSSHANAYASAHGLQIETKKKKKKSGDGYDDDDGPDSSSYQSAPVSLLPNAYPSSMFDRAKSLSRPFNELVDRISRDGEFLRETLGGDVSDADPFTAKLLELYESIYLDDDDANAENNNKKGEFARGADRLGIQRSDYMLNEAQRGPGDESSVGGNDGGRRGRRYELKQVELNTIAASFAGLASNCAGMHRHLTSRFRDEVRDFLEGNARTVMGDDDRRAATATEEEEGVGVGVPENPALTCLPRAMHLAHERYANRFLDDDSESGRNAVVLFVVQEGETNTVDQRMLEFALWENHGVPVVRMSLTAAHQNLELDEDTGALFVSEGEYSPVGGRREVSAAYFRAGYAPTDYPDGYDNGIEWLSREKIERGRCAKCPNLGYHLAGTKKVQQELARPGALERFFPKDDEGDKVEAMRGAFAGLYSLGSDAAERDLDAIRDAIGGGDGRYVLKPQREGGGYNYYGRDLAEKIRSNVDVDVEGDGDVKSIVLGKDLAEFILMERLFPPRQTAVLLRSGLVEGYGRSVSELGCFGTILTDADGTVISNEYGGWILRTKFEDVDEGGVASGFATLSSPYLC